MTYLLVFFAALQFLTRIPLNLPFLNGRITGEIMAKSISCFPLVGLLMGCIVWAFFIIGNHLFNPWTAAAMIIAVQIILSGGLHIDGFMDTSDALFSHKSRHQMLEIMRDSRVGALGAASAIVLLLLKFSLLAQLTFEASFVILTSMLVLSRWTLVIAIVVFPYAREAGLGKAFQGNKGLSSFLVACLFTFFILLSLQTPYLFLVWLAVSILTFLIGKWLSSLLGGLTGDTYGWLSEISEIICLMLLIVYLV
ncbi:MAG: adenosylcobinamide-GDP ribazoletransferase [Syntrophomonadaceae bacterium]|nr:adenosylcobinamide-GDP ribazoletransferase [Syntrophomonadaceae bacterium]